MSSVMPSDEKDKPDRAKLADRSELAREIDENLKRVYRESLEEPVPDRFAALLDALKAKEAGRKGGQS
ncbi:MAG: NepR family anti-sigma factor [Paracoccaceae bacterium]